MRQTPSQSCSASARSQAIHRVFVLLASLGFNIEALPQQTVTSTRVEQAEWVCEDAAGIILSNHTRQDKAMEACSNRALANPGQDFYIRPSAYRIVATPQGTGNLPPAGQAVLTWRPPTTNTDGSPLDLAGYTVYWQPSGATSWDSVYFADPSANSYTVEPLTPGDWLFTVKAVDTGGLDSAHSNVAIKTVN